MYMALYPKNDIDNTCKKKKKKKGGRGLISIEDSVDASVRQLKDYVKKSN